MKALQLLGNLSPLFLVLLSYSLFGSHEPNTPSYITASLIIFCVFGIGAFFILVIPSSFILLKDENRRYFSFKSKGWLLVLAINWLYIGLFCLSVLLFVITLYVTLS